MSDVEEVSEVKERIKALIDGDNKNITAVIVVADKATDKNEMFIVNGTMAEAFELVDGARVMMQTLAEEMSNAPKPTLN